MANNEFYPYPGYIEVVGFESMRDQVEDAAQELINANNATDSSQSEKIAENTANINAEVERSKNADAEFESDLAEEIDERKRMGGILNGKIADEKNARETSDKALQDALNTVNKNVADGFNAVNDNISLIVNEINKNIADGFNTINGGIATEIEERKNADAELQVALDAEVIAREGNEQALRDLIDDQKAARVAADEELKKMISEEASIREGNDQALRDLIDDQKAARIAADEELKKLISEEASVREGNDQAIRDLVDDQKAARVAADEALSKHIQEVADAAKSYTLVKMSETEVNKELGANVREGYKLIDEDGVKVGDYIKVYKDTSLGLVQLVDQNLELTYILADGSRGVVKIDFSKFLAESEFKEGLQVNSDGVVSIKLNETCEGYLTVSENGIKLSGIDAKFAEEAIVREGNDQAIRDLIDDQKAARVAADEELKKMISEEAKVRESNDQALRDLVDDQKAARVAADEELKKLISEEASVREGNEQAIRDLIDDQKAARVAADEALEGSIDSMVVKVASLQSELNEEKSARIASDEALEGSIDGMVAKVASLQSELNEEKSARIAAEEALQSAIDGMVAKVAMLQSEVNSMKKIIESNETVKAISSLGKGETLDLVLTNDLVITDKNIHVAEGATLNINLNGKTIENNVKDILFRVEGTLVIEGEGKVKSKLYAASANEGGNILVKSGNFECKTTCFQSNGGVVKIEGGYYDAYDETYNGKYTLNFIDKMKEVGDIEVIGGTFVGYDPSNSYSENPKENFLGEGYKVEELVVDGISNFTVVKE